MRCSRTVERELLLQDADEALSECRGFPRRQVRAVMTDKPGESRVVGEMDRWRIDGGSKPIPELRAREAVFLCVAAQAADREDGENHLATPLLNPVHGGIDRR